jgi:hypothetical protein
MFHPAKVLKIFSPENKNIDSGDIGTQAMVEMWDKNIFTFSVHKDIAKKIKSGNVVLVDYSPRMRIPHPKYVIIKILNKEEGEQTWKTYKEYFETRQSQSKPLQIQAQKKSGGNEFYYTG